jgi:hypothetical protein
MAAISTGKRVAMSVAWSEVISGGETHSWARSMTLCIALRNLLSRASRAARVLTTAERTALGMAVSYVSSHKRKLRKPHGIRRSNVSIETSVRFNEKIK